MKLADKLQLFLAGALLPGRLQGPAELASAGMTGAATRAQHLLMEKKVAMHSDVIAASGMESFVGAYSYMNPGGYLRGRVFIGRFCSIGRRVSIGAGTHVMKGVSTHPLLLGEKSPDYTEAERASLWPHEGVALLPRSSFTVLGNDVWVGDGAVVVPGVSIGTGAVIGANAVVTRDVPAYAVAAGSPANVLKRRFPEEVVAQLLASEYWEYPLETLAKTPMRHVLGFLAHLAASCYDTEEYETFQLRP